MSMKLTLRRLMVGVIFYLPLLAATEAQAQRPEDARYPNTVIRAPTEEERIQFRYLDLLRQHRPRTVMESLALKERAKREILGSRYNPPRQSKAGSVIKWGSDTLSEQINRNGNLPGVGGPPYRQYPARRLVPVTTPPFNGSGGPVFQRRLPLSVGRRSQFLSDTQNQTRRSIDWKPALRSVLNSILNDR